MMTWLAALRRLPGWLAPTVVLCGTGALAADAPAVTPDPTGMTRPLATGDADPFPAGEYLHVTEPTWFDPHDAVRMPGGSGPGWQGQGRVRAWQPGGRFRPTDGDGDTGGDIFLLHPPSRPSLDPWLDVLTEPGQTSPRPGRDGFDHLPAPVEPRFNPAGPSGRISDGTGDVPDGVPGVLPAMLRRSVPEPTTVFFMAAALAWATHRPARRGRIRRTKHTAAG